MLLGYQYYQASPVARGRSDMSLVLHVINYLGQSLFMHNRSMVRLLLNGHMIICVDHMCYQASAPQLQVIQSKSFKANTSANLNHCL